MSVRIFALLAGGSDFQFTGDGTQIGDPVVGLDGMAALNISARLAYGSGGATITALISTSLDQGTTWTPIARFDFTTVGMQKVANISGFTPVPPYVVAALEAEGIQDGVLGDRLRCDVTSTGGYAGSTVLSIRVAVR
jgi:hypothetical protein